MSGTIMAQAIPILIAPVLTRLYSPEEFGAFALYLAVGSIVAIASSGQYEKAILLPEDDAEALNIVFLALFIAAAVSCLSLIAILLFHDGILGLLSLNGLSLWIYTIPAYVASSQLYQIFYYWWNRQSHFKRIAANRILQSTVSAGLSLVIGITRWKSGGLILGALAGQIISGAVLAYFTFERTSHFRGVSWRQMQILAKRYISFPKYSVPANFINTASSQVPLVLLSSFFGMTVTGYFSLTQRVLGAPISLIANSILDVFKQRASSDYTKSGNCRRIYVETLKYLSLLSILPFIALFLFAPFVFSIVFGPQWAIAGDYARLLAPLFLLRFTVSPLSYVLYITQKQKYDLIWQIGLFLLTSGSILLGHQIDGPMWSIGLFSLTYSLMYLIYMWVSYQASGGEIKNT